jgi:hypothetical protein
VFAGAVLALAEVAAHRDWLLFGSGLVSTKSALYPTEAEMFAAMLGFLIAGAAVLLASSNIEKLKVSGFHLYKLLAGSFRDSMYALIGAIAYVVAAMIFDQSKSDVSWAAGAVVVLILVLARVARAARRLYYALLI